MGEKSEAYIGKLDISKTHIGISSKDGSVTNLDDAIIKSTQICLSKKEKTRILWWYN